jgi:hypothetical protein
MRIAILIVLCLRVAAGCEVVASSVKDAVKQAQIVFRGTVTDISDSEITFRVDRVWKGPVTARFSMPKVTWSETPCMPGFYQGHLKLGAEFLVYARRVPEFNVSGYIPTPGSRTAPIEYAAEDLKKLGPGHQSK